MRKFNVGSGGEHIILSMICLLMVFIGGLAGVIFPLWAYLLYGAWFIGCLVFSRNYTEVSGVGLVIHSVLSRKRYYGYEDIQSVQLYKGYTLVCMKSGKSYFYHDDALNLRNLVFECGLRCVHIIDNRCRG